MNKSLENLNNQLLLISSANGEVDNVKKYLKEGAFINIKDANGYTPLHCACFNKHLKVAEVLIEAGADCKLKDTQSYGFTPLHFASAFGLTDLVKILLKSKDPEIQSVLSTQEQKSALALASTQEIKQILINDQMARKNPQKQKENENQKQLPPKKKFEILYPRLKQDDQPNKVVEKPKVKVVVDKQIEKNEEEKCEKKIEEKVGEKKKDCEKSERKRRIWRMITIFLFIFFPLFSLWFFPYGFPLYIYPCGLIVGIVAFKALRQRKENLQKKGVYQLSIHLLISGIINGIFVISNIYGGGFPWSLFSLFISLFFLTLHALKTKFKNSKYNKKFYVHLLLFILFTGLIFVTYIFGGCHPYRRYHKSRHHHFGRYRNHYHRHHHRYHHRHHMGICRRSIFGFLFWMLPVLIWSILLYVHYMKFRKAKVLGCCGVKISFNSQQINK